MRNSPRKLHTEHDSTQQYTTVHNSTQQYTTVHNSTQQTTTILDKVSSVTMRSVIILAVYSEFCVWCKATRHYGELKENWINMSFKANQSAL